MVQLLILDELNWWIVFVVWLTDEWRSALFPVGTIVREPHHRESLTRREQGLSMRRSLSCMELCSSDNHYTTVPIGVTFPKLDYVELTLNTQEYLPNFFSRRMKIAHKTNCK